MTDTPTNCTYPVNDIAELKRKMLNWANRFNIFCFLDNHNYTIEPHQYDCLLAAGSGNFTSSESLNDLDSFQEKNPGWLFGHLSYELKNSIYHLNSPREDRIGFPQLFFFVPQFLIKVQANELVIFSNDPNEVYRQIINTDISVPSLSTSLSIQQRLTREQYIQTIQALQKHIVRGDCYEINFCQEFFCENAEIDPVAIFERLVEISPTPFSALYKLNDSFLVCASPERFITKKEGQIFSQPMKGTIKRAFDKREDEKLKDELKRSSKDRSENVMVVDLVRNDLTKICIEDSLKVDELFGIYSYPQVHQMISTISGMLKPRVKFSEIIEATFPMGSMTGAPKYRVMQLIDEYESSARGIFSGSVGYINPERDFDFNVVIRSLMYNSSEKYLSYQVGSGITFYSEPEKEWEECLLKAAAIKKVLTT